ncbi:MAG: hypothetical protein FWD66_01840 [Paludibacter sp.]|nr:hypothetical protein [Paludibacter sp.]
MLTFGSSVNGNFDEFECKKNDAENQWFTKTLVRSGVPARDREAEKRKE